MSERRRIPEAQYGYKRLGEHALRLRNVRHLGLVAYLTLRLDVPCLTDERPEWRETLRNLKENLGYDLSERTLRRDLHEVRDGGWIGFEPPSGNRREWTFWLDGAAVYDQPVSSQCPASVQPGWSRRVPLDGANPRGYAQSEPLLAGHAAPLRVEKEKEIKTPLRGGFPPDDDRTERPPGEDFSNEGKAPNPGAKELVAAFVNECRDGGYEPTRSDVGAVAQSIKQMLDEDFEAKWIVAGWRRMLAKVGVAPPLLQEFVAEASVPTNGSRVARALQRELEQARAEGREDECLAEYRQRAGEMVTGTLWQQALEALGLA